MDIPWGWGRLWAVRQENDMSHKTYNEAGFAEGVTKTFGILAELPRGPRERAAYLMGLHSALEKTMARIQEEIVKANLEKVHPGACCNKAKFAPCVCAWCFDCPDHGVTHVGSHD